MGAHPLSFKGTGLQRRLFEDGRHRDHDPFGYRSPRDESDRLVHHRDGMLALARGAEAKDTDIGEHVVRVHLTSTRLAAGAGLRDEAAADIGWAAMLHDVGKLHVPDRILFKPGPLSADEWAVMREHPIWGERIISTGNGFDLARRIARCTTRTSTAGATRTGSPARPYRSRPGSCGSPTRSTR